MVRFQHFLQTLLELKLQNISCLSGNSPRIHSHGLIRVWQKVGPVPTFLRFNQRNIPFYPSERELNVYNNNPTLQISGRDQSRPLLNWHVGLAHLSGTFPVTFIHRLLLLSSLSLFFFFYHFNRYFCLSESLHNKNEIKLAANLGSSGQHCLNNNNK